MGIEKNFKCALLKAMEGGYVSSDDLFNFQNLTKKELYELISKKYYARLLVIFELLDVSSVKPPKIEPTESSYSEIEKRKQKKEEQYIRETNEVEQNYILGEKFRSRLELLQENKTFLD